MDAVLRQALREGGGADTIVRWAHEQRWFCGGGAAMRYVWVMFIVVQTLGVVGAVVAALLGIRTIMISGPLLSLGGLLLAVV